MQCRDGLVVLTKLHVAVQDGDVHDRVLGVASEVCRCISCAGTHCMKCGMECGKEPLMGTQHNCQWGSATFTLYLGIQSLTPPQDTINTNK
jgi:hypothetical protein